MVFLFLLVFWNVLHVCVCVGVAVQGPFVQPLVVLVGNSWIWLVFRVGLSLCDVDVWEVHVVVVVA